MKWRNSKRVQAAIANAENLLFNARNSVITSIEKLWQSLECNTCHKDITYWRVQAALNDEMRFNPRDKLY